MWLDNIKLKDSFSIVFFTMKLWTLLAKYFGGTLTINHMKSQVGGGQPRRVAAENSKSKSAILPHEILIWIFPPRLVHICHGKSCSYVSSAVRNLHFSVRTVFNIHTILLPVKIEDTTDCPSATFQYTHNILS